jgi:hypothetical protein
VAGVRRVPRIRTAARPVDAPQQGSAKTQFVAGGDGDGDEGVMRLMSKRSYKPDAVGLTPAIRRWLKR